MSLDVHSHSLRRSDRTAGLAQNPHLALAQGVHAAARFVVVVVQQVLLVLAAVWLG